MFWEGGQLAYHWQAKLFDLQFFTLVSKEKLSTRWSDQQGKIVFRAGQFAHLRRFYTKPSEGDKIQNKE